jgi:hypothetical protein
MNGEKQRVYLSRTQSGRPGWFTGRMLVIGITEEEYAKLAGATNQVLGHAAAKLGFQFDNDAPQQYVVPATLKPLKLKGVSP